ncbi:MAG: ATP-binding protein [Chloroflexota bacterium]
MLPDFRVRQRDYLLEISRAISQELDLDALLTRIVRISAEMLAGQAGLIALRRDMGGWEFATTHGIPASFIRYLNVLLAQIQPMDNPVHTELPQVQELIQELNSSASLGFLASVGLPLVVFERLIGVIFIFRSYMGVFSSDDYALLQAFADQAAITVNNAQLYTQVSHEKQRMDALLDTVADGILILSANRKIERTNPAFERMIGISRKEIIGKSHETIVHWKHRRHGMTLEEAEAGGWPLTPEAILYTEGNLERKDGTDLPVGITYAPLLSGTNALLNTIATVRDITRFREAEEIKSTFISVVSHELKTPVALIKGYVATLRREDASWDQAIIKDSLQVIEEEADRLAELIENLLDASRLQAGGFKLNLAQVNLEQLFQRIINKFRQSTVDMAKFGFISDFPNNFPTILGDENRLTQVINNLISNAIKYSPTGGEVRVNGQVRQDVVIICISDHGQGISPADAPYIFDRFFRASESSRKTKGAGLGLYLTRSIIETHGGSIWVDPHYNDGARICFSLPR